MGDGYIPPAAKRDHLVFAHIAFLPNEKGRRFCDALEWFDAGALFEGTGVIYMKAPFFQQGPARQSPDFRRNKKGALFERMTNQKRRLLLLVERMGSSPISSRKSGLPIFCFSAEIRARKTPEKADRMRFYTHPI